MLLRRAASLLSGRSALAQRLPSLLRAPPPLLGGLLHARHVYTPPKAENSPPAPGERLAVLFPRGKRLQVSMEVKKRVLKSNPHMGSKRLKRMVRKHARRGSYNSFVAEYESRLDRFLWRINVAASPFASRVLITSGHVMVNGQVIKQHSHTLTPYDIIEPNRANGRRPPRVTKEEKEAATAAAAAAQEGDNQQTEAGEGEGEGGEGGEGGGARRAAFRQDEVGGS